MRHRGLHICIVKRFKPGDLPPTDYLGWHEWARVQMKAGIRQTQCKCGKWLTPQEQKIHLCSST